MFAPSGYCSLFDVRLRLATHVMLQFPLRSGPVVKKDMANGPKRQHPSRDAALSMTIEVVDQAMARLLSDRPDIFVCLTNGTTLRVSPAIFLQHRDDHYDISPEIGLQGFWFVNELNWSVDVNIARRFLEVAAAKREALGAALRSAPRNSRTTKDINSKLRNLSAATLPVQQGLQVLAALDGLPICLLEDQAPTSPAQCDRLIRDDTPVLPITADLESWLLRVTSAKALYSEVFPSGLGSATWPEASERIAEYSGHVFHPDIIRRAVT
jgi:hypothetical protein